MTKRLIYVIGYPGSGKTTAVRSALDGLDSKLMLEPVKHTVYGNGLIQLGCEREVHGGTDVLAFNIQPKVIDWLPSCTAPLVIGEGDRLANGLFFRAVQGQGRRLKIVHIKVGELVALKRMMNRGSRFDPAWIRRTMTKVDNLASNWRSSVVVVDGTRSMDSVGEELKGLLYAV
tara:strand:- start:95 stop:616 length:522 start_codon:yes stop_codon:yes gene_type:complete